MKYSIQLLAVLAAVSCLNPVAQADSRIMPLKPQFAFSPKGFDSNDNAQVVLAGYFTDYCMKVGATDHRIDIANKVIYIDQHVSMMSNCNDLEMYIPYSIEVSLGALPVGEYDVMVLDLDHKYTKMTVLPVTAAGSNKTDERLYAQVTSIEYKNAEKPGTPLLVIHGVFTNSCFELASVEVIARPGDIFEVLPILSKAKTDCTAGIRPFVKTVALKGFPAREALIHVRAMNGQSFNKIVTELDRIIGL